MKHCEQQTNVFLHFNSSKVTKLFSSRFPKGFLRSHVHPSCSLLFASRSPFTLTLLHVDIHVSYSSAFSAGVTFAGVGDGVAAVSRVTLAAVGPGRVDARAADTESRDRGALVHVCNTTRNRCGCFTASASGVETAVQSLTPPGQVDVVRAKVLCASDPTLHLA